MGEGEGGGGGGEEGEAGTAPAGKSEDCVLERQESLWQRLRENANPPAPSPLNPPSSSSHCLPTSHQHLPSPPGPPSRSAPRIIAIFALHKSDSLAS